MEISFDKTEKTQGIVKISVNKADYQQDVAQKIKEYSKTANIKGFRPGKVPPGIIRKLYGKAVIVEQVNKLVYDQLDTYLKESDTQFLGEPIPGMQEETYDWENQESFEFNYNVGFALPFELKIDKKLTANKYNIKVDDQVIDGTMENLQRQFGEIENPGTSSEKDTLYGSVKSSDGKIDQEVNIDLRDVEKAPLKKLTGLKVGDTVQIDPKKTFKNRNALKYQLQMSDEDYVAVKDKLDFILKSINHYKLAEVDEELFDKTFGEGTVKTEDEFRNKIKETVLKNYEGESKNFFDHKLKEILVDQAKIELPDSFLRSWLVRTNENVTEELLDVEYTVYAKELKWSLVRNKLINDQEIKVEHEDVMNEAKKLIKRQFASSGLDGQMDDQLDAFANNYLRAENGDNYRKVLNQIQDNKVLDYIKAGISVKDNEVTLDEFRTL